MWSRLGSRGLPIVLSLVALLLATPTPVPRTVVQSWTTARLAAAAGDLGSATEALENPGFTSPWLVALKADSIRLALAQGDGTRALALLEISPDPQAPSDVIGCWRAEALALVGRWEEFDPVAPAHRRFALPRTASAALCTRSREDRIRSDRSSHRHPSATGDARSGGTGGRHAPGGMPAPRGTCCRVCDASTAIGTRRPAGDGPRRGRGHIATRQIGRMC